EMTDYNSMSYDNIHSFLRKKGSLNELILMDKNGITQYAAEIIYRAAQDYQINPKVLLVTLQKEQSLIECDSYTEDRLDWAMGYAVCDDCSKDDPLIQKFKGFGKQVDRAAWRLNYYAENPEQFNYRVGKSHIIDGQTVIPVNQATASLYNYTPHLHGNSNFRKIWDRWFSRSYPDGTLIRVKAVDKQKSTIWVIQQGTRREITSMSVLLSRFDINNLIDVNATDLDQYPEGVPIKYSNYSLLKSPKGTVYLLVNDTLRGFASAEVFKTMGYQWDEVEDISWEDLANYQEGQPLTMNSVYPLGSLLQDKTTGGVYYVADGLKHPIWSKELMDVNYSKRKITPVTPAELDKYTTAEPVMFPDGELIKSPGDPKVYVISNGQKRPIANEFTFIALGYKWQNIITTTDKALALHQTGEEIQWEE
ncbi:MAG: hypothetical protein V1692_02380, partial [bacterium]